MAFRLHDPNPVYMNLLGTAPAALGSLETFEAGDTTTPLATCNSAALSVANPVIIPLDSDGRANVEIFSGVDFCLRLKDADDNVIWTREITSGIPADQDVPMLEEGEFLSGDGENFVAVTLVQLPDPTGSAEYMVVVNSEGDGYELQVQPEMPEAPELDITVGTSSFIVGDGESTTKQVFLAGSATGAVSGTRTQSVSVVYAEPFASTPRVICQLATSGGLASGQNQPSPNLTASTSAGFTVLWMMGETDDDRTQFDFNAAVTFDWIAFGTRVIAE
jgi:hypothetical protein